MYVAFVQFGSNLQQTLTVRCCMLGRKKGAEGSVLQQLCHFVILAIFLIVHTLCNQLLLEPSVYCFNTLQVCYRYTEDVHEEV